MFKRDWLYILIFVVALPVGAYGHSCSRTFSKSLQEALPSSLYKSLVEDFKMRDSLPESPHLKSNWLPSWGKWGPWPSRFPKPTLPKGVNPMIWAQYRVEAVARKYIGLPYKHRHIPSMGGLDCSNFTSWVYNYGLGIYIRSNISIQSQEAGRRLHPEEPLQKGDLVFFWNKDQTRVSHVAIYLEGQKVIDSSRGGIKVRNFDKMKRIRGFAWARRVLDDEAH